MQVSFLLDLQRREVKAFDETQDISVVGNQKRHGEAVLRQQVSADSQKVLLKEATKGPGLLGPRSSSNHTPKTKVPDWDDLPEATKNELLAPPVPRQRSRSQSGSDSFDYGGLVKQRALSFQDLSHFVNRPGANKDKDKESPKLSKPISAEKDALLSKHQADLKLMTETQSRRRKDLRELQGRELDELVESNRRASEQLQKRLQEDIESVVSEGNAVIQGFLAEHEGI